MPTDAVLRTLAVIAAVAILAAPYRGLVVDALQAGVEWAKAHAATLSRVAATGLILAAAWGKVPLPTFEVPAVTVTVETPSPELQAAVKPLAVELAKLPAGDRMLWASTWNKAALVAAGDATAKEIAFPDTRSLRGLTALALDIAWRRIGGHAPGGNEPLRKALESAYASEVGTADVPTSRDVRDRYAAFAKAVAWAGVNGG